MHQTWEVKASWVQHLLYIVTSWSFTCTMLRNCSLLAAHTLRYSQSDIKCNGRRSTATVLRSFPYHTSSITSYSDRDASQSHRIPLSRSVADTSINSIVKRYLELAKFRLSALVVVTSGAGFICTGLPIDYSLLTTTCLGTALCAASAGTFNQIIEKERDGWDSMNE
jgi:hypothetical protein